MRVGLAYAPRPGPLGAARPLVAAIYLAPLAILVFAVSSPPLLLATGLATYLVALCSRAGAAVRAPLHWAAALALFIVAVNALVSQRGDTVLVRGFELPVLGRLDVTLEAIAEGAVLGLRVLVALLVFAVWSACVDPDRVLKGVRPLARRSALTATLIARLVPLAAADVARLSEAGSLRGPGAAPVGRGALARRIVAGSLDRAVDVAATLELRGYGLPGAVARPAYRRQPGEPSLLLAGALLLAIAAIAALGPLAGFDAYPTVAVDLGVATFVLAALIPLAALLPFAPDLARNRGRPRFDKLAPDD